MKMIQKEIKRDKERENDSNGEKKIQKTLKKEKWKNDYKIAVQRCPILIHQKMTTNY